MNRKDLREMDKDVRDIILKYGRDILASEAFQDTFSQTHHYSSTVGDHTLGVTVEAVKICLRHCITDDETLCNVVSASLCHDLGIMGRDEKFRNNVQCLMRHPADSVEAYKKLRGEDNVRVLDSIRNHMFPLRLRLPKYKEGWILMIADKLASAREKTDHPSITEAERDELLAAVNGTSC